MDPTNVRLLTLCTILNGNGRVRYFRLQLEANFTNIIRAKGLRSVIRRLSRATNLRVSLLNGTQRVLELYGTNLGRLHVTKGANRQNLRLVTSVNDGLLPRLFVILARSTIEISTFNGKSGLLVKGVILGVVRVFNRTRREKSRYANRRDYRRDNNRRRYGTTRRSNERNQVVGEPSHFYVLYRTRGLAIKRRCNVMVNLMTRNLKVTSIPTRAFNRNPASLQTKRVILRKLVNDEFGRRTTILQSRNSTRVVNGGKQGLLQILRRVVANTCRVNFPLGTNPYLDHRYLIGGGSTGHHHRRRAGRTRRRRTMTSLFFRTTRLRSSPTSSSSIDLWPALHAIRVCLPTSPDFLHEIQVYVSAIQLSARVSIPRAAYEVISHIAAELIFSDDGHDELCSL